MHNPVIAVFGDLMLDRYWFGSVKRISPEAPIPIINVIDSDDRLGGAANVALNIQSLGYKVALAGAIGNDIEGSLFLELCQKYQISPHFIKSTDFKTITKLRIISRQQHMLRCDFEQKYPDLLLTQKYSNELYALIKNSTIIVLSDYQKGFLKNPQKLIECAVSHQKPIIIDPKGNDFTKYKNATILTPNKTEFETIVGVCNSENEFLSKGEKLRQELNLQALLITRSEEGMTLIQKNSPPFSIPAKAKDIYDVTGAGDTVIATLATCLAEKKDFIEATTIANIAASIVVGRLGASQITQKELNQAINNQDRAHHLVLTLNELKKEIVNAKTNHETIVMTNGCFDILHKGHVTYLNEARKLGDRLVVALNSDSSIKRIKGEDRPIMDENSRACVLASLSAVDWVIIFDENTPENLIKQLLPDILVKGSDYKIDEIAGANAVLANGGKVELLNFVEGYSTSNVIKKIKQNK